MRWVWESRQHFPRFLTSFSSDGVQQHMWQRGLISTGIRASFLSSALLSSFSMVGVFIINGFAKDFSSFRVFFERFIRWMAETMTVFLNFRIRYGWSAGVT